MGRAGDGSLSHPFCLNFYTIFGAKNRRKITQLAHSDKSWVRRWRVSWKRQSKDVYRRTIEIPQCAGIFKVNCWLKVHNAYLKLASLISGQVGVVGGRKRSPFLTSPHSHLTSKPSAETIRELGSSFSLLPHTSKLSWSRSVTCIYLTKLVDC